MIERPGFVAEIVILFWLCAIFNRIGAMLISPTFIRILSSPREILLPIAAALGVLGAWAAGFTRFDIYSMLGFGVLGFFFRQKKLPAGAHGSGNSGGTIRRHFSAAGPFDL